MAITARVASIRFLRTLSAGAHQRLPAANQLPAKRRLALGNHLHLLPRIDGLRFLRSRGTIALFDRFRIKHPAPYERTKKRKKRKRKRSPAPTLPETLSRVKAWQQDIDDGATRADIARREGLTRARVTQLMKLLELPGKLQKKIMTGEDEVSGWTIRHAIQMATEGGLA